MDNNCQYRTKTIFDHHLEQLVGHLHNLKNFSIYELTFIVFLPESLKQVPRMSLEENLTK
jgi:hypothetical protein